MIYISQGWQITIILNATYIHIISWEQNKYIAHKNRQNTILFRVVLRLWHKKGNNYFQWCVDCAYKKRFASLNVISKAEKENTFDRWDQMHCAVIIRKRSEQVIYCSRPHFVKFSVVFVSWACSTLQCVCLNSESFCSSHSSPCLPWAAVHQNAPHHSSSEPLFPGVDGASTHSRCSHASPQ